MVITSAPVPVNKLHLIFTIALLTLVGCADIQPAERQRGQVVVCHKSKTINVSNPDYLRHIEHGDVAGACAN
jgi:hypothetical protein